MNGFFKIRMGTNEAGLLFSILLIVFLLGIEDSFYTFKNNVNKGTIRQFSPLQTSIVDTSDSGSDSDDSVIKFSYEICGKIFIFDIYLFLESVYSYDDNSTDDEDDDVIDSIFFFSFLFF
jgi:hypothetical protein